jgi:cyclic beta-1,2-glucan synthetase
LKSSLKLRTYVGVAFVVPTSVFLVLATCQSEERFPYAHWVLFLLLFVPLLNFGLSLSRAYFSAKTDSVRLPRNSSLEESLSEYPTAVVIPVKVKSATDADLALAALRENHLAGVPDRVPLLLLVDYRDWHQIVHPDDAHLTELLESVVAKLNQEVSSQSPRFGLVVRARKFNPAAGIWMGWERKRGKLVDFLKFIEAGDEQESFTVYHCPAFHSLRLVLTLDLDARLTRGAVETLVKIATHPNNRPVLRDGKLVQGYTILAPYIKVVADRPSFFFEASEAP